jgi:hypothetical protein
MAKFVAQKFKMAINAEQSVNIEPYICILENEKIFLFNIHIVKTMPLEYLST